MSLRILHIEDNEDDLLLTARHLANSGLAVEIDRAETLDGIRVALTRGSYDVVLADFELGGFNGIDALAIVREADAYLPFILVSGEVGEPVAVALMRAGAQDFVMKDSLARLAPVIEREVREAEVRRERDQAEHANIIKSEFLASMSHELRTPLNSIIGFSSILSSGLAGELNEEQAKQIAMVHEAGEHLLALVNDILDISKIEADKFELTADEFLLLDAVSAARELTASLWRDKGLTFEIIDECPGCAVVTDRRALDQILRNLVGNAVKFTETGGITIRTRTAQHARVSIDVIDTGIGIATQELALVFDEFHQTRKARNYAHGTGLGLAISRKLAGALGGEIRVSSAEGVGTTFTLTIPCALDTVTGECVGTE